MSDQKKLKQIERVLNQPLLVYSEDNPFKNSYGVGKNQQVTTLSFNEVDESTFGKLTPLIADLSSLKKLVLFNSPSVDLSIVSDLRGLLDLELYGFRLSDLNALVEIIQHSQSLRRLEIDASEVSDISPLAKLQNLTSLSLDNNQITNIAPIENLWQLEELSLAGNQISDIKSLSKLNILNSLQLRSNQINDISPLGNLVNLRVLWLLGNKIQELENIRPLISLRH